MVEHFYPDTIIKVTNFENGTAIGEIGYHLTPLGILEDCN